MTDIISVKLLKMYLSKLMHICLLILTYYTFLKMKKNCVVYEEGTVNDQTCWKGFTKIPKENFLLNNGPVFVRPVENDPNENVTCEITINSTISTVENHMWLLYNLNGGKSYNWNIFVWIIT